MMAGIKFPTSLNHCTMERCYCASRPVPPLFNHRTGPRRDECPDGYQCLGQAHQVCSRHGRNVGFGCIMTTDRPSMLNLMGQMEDKDWGRGYSFRSEGMCRVTEVPATCLKKHYWRSHPPECVNYKSCPRPDICPYLHDDDWKKEEEKRLALIKEEQYQHGPCADGMMCEYLRTCKHPHHESIHDRPMCAIPMCDYDGCTHMHPDGRTKIGRRLASRRAEIKGAKSWVGDVVIREKAPPKLSDEDEYPTLGRKPVAKGRR